MFKKFNTFCTHHPWLVILSTLLITVGAIYQIRTRIYFEGDITKFLPKDLKAVKANDYSQKNFNYQETLMVGVEYPGGSILEPALLRNIENIVLGLKGLKAEKTFESQLTGAQETLSLPIGIDTEDISSIANLEDVVLDQVSGSVVTGSVNAKLKQDLGMISDPGFKERLPESNDDLMRIIPGLRQRVRSDRIFLGTLLSKDEHAGNIRIPMIRKWDYKRRWAMLELETAMEPTRLRDRYQGKDSTFPFTVFGKRYQDTVYGEAFIARHTSVVAKNLRTFLIQQFEPVFENHPDLKQLLASNMTVDRFREVMRLTENRDFFLSPEIRSWDQFLGDLYEFMLQQIDPLSRENLEFQFYDVRDIYNLKVNYELITRMVNNYTMDGVKFHIAGQPVVVALISHMMKADMGRMLPIAVGIIFLMLIISFRNLAGLIIPLFTVICSVIWTMGLMATAGVPLSISTTSMPIVLLAIGTAYGIHLLNRYFSEVRTTADRPTTISKTFDQVGTAVIMAALTTMAGFGSLAFSTLPNLQQYGIFSAIGVALALLLSFALTPAILMLIKSGGKENKTTDTGDHTQTAPARQPQWPLASIKFPKTTLLIASAITVLAIMGAWSNYFEGDPIINFKQDNPLSQADRFINQSLTGTNMVNLIFRFRDQIDLSSDQSRSDLINIGTAFINQWDTFVADHPDLATSWSKQLTGDLKSSYTASQPDLTRITQQLYLIKNLLDEDFLGVETESPAADETVEVDTVGADASLLSTTGDESLDSLSDLEDMESPTDSDIDETGDPDQLAGINQLLEQMDISGDEKADGIRWIQALRLQKSTPRGLAMQRAFNQFQDFFASDMKQPVVLHKLETLYQELKAAEHPVVIKGGQSLPPTGLITSPVDLVRKVYKTFYHDDNPDFDRLPDTERDGFSDITLTDRSLIGVALNQSQSSSQDRFNAMVTPDYKEFQLMIMIRSGQSRIIDEYVELVSGKLADLFPEDDPYIERILIGGLAPQLREVTGLLMSSQLKSIAGSFLLVWIITFFIFRSAMGGLYALLPLGFTVLLNFGMMYAMGWPITQGTVIMASIAIGIGVDYTIHFLERFKRQLQEGDTLEQAYLNTIQTSGRAIFINALSVALGFMVLVFSDFIPVIAMGVLMMGTMLFSTVGALIILPAVIYVTRPRFIQRQNGVVSSTTGEPSPN